MYSDWFPVPKNKSTIIYEIQEGKKFQVRTDKRIDSVHDIRWSLKGVGLLQFTSKELSAYKCGGTGKKFNGTHSVSKGFLLRPGVMTFLKTNTQLQIWFDDVLEVTWVYEDKDAPCRMRGLMTGLSFRAINAEDKVSTHYRYEIGD